MRDASFESVGYEIAEAAVFSCFAIEAMRERTRTFPEERKPSFDGR